MFPNPGCSTLLVLCLLVRVVHAQTDSATHNESYSSSGEQLVNDLHQRCFTYFLELSDSISGLTHEKYPEAACSDVAATGFSLAAYIIGAENHYISHRQAIERVLRTLRFLVKLPAGKETAGKCGYRGFYYHQLDFRKGIRCGYSLLSPQATAILLAGALCCMTYFDAWQSEEREIRRLAKILYRRADWNWMCHAEETPCSGWSPEIGFNLEHLYGYDESMLMMILALGSPSHPLPVSSWKAWTSSCQWASAEGFDYLQCAPLAGHQLAHAFLDLRGVKDDLMRQTGIDYFENSRRATLAQMNYAIRNPLRFRDYSKTIWGFSTCDGPGNTRAAWRTGESVFKGRTVRGFTGGFLSDDGTVCPAAAGCSLPFAYEECRTAIDSIYRKYGSKVYRRYGFVNAFNPSFTGGQGNFAGWFSPYTYGADAGMLLLLLENQRSGLIWKIMKKNEYVAEGLRRAGFSK
ncbi:MAG TPA: glucoamylase family protein [Bacteroidales bacterium]|nr:glucoamylase family protein [Bacteroidales bacterium]HSA44861.1 glucoamylase family protein [Bacteroidales bacterium]